MSQVDIGRLQNEAYEQGVKDTKLKVKETVNNINGKGIYLKLVSEGYAEFAQRCLDSKRRRILKAAGINE